MYEYIQGSLIEKNPTFCTVETGGIGYFIQITLTTFSEMGTGDRVKLYLHQVVREDAICFMVFTPDRNGKCSGSCSRFPA